MKIAVLGSTNGSDLLPIINAINDGTLHDVQIQFVLSNNANAGILEKARNAGVWDVYIDPKGHTRLEYDERITRLLVEYNVDLVLLIGYMRLMTSSFVERWKNKVINVHPSLLPAFAGGMDTNVHEKVLARGCKMTGTTLIFIDQGADTGPIIMQKAVPVLQTDTVDSIKERVQYAEQKILIKTLGLYRDGKIHVVDDKVVIG